MRHLVCLVLAAVAASTAMAQTHPACGGEHHYRWAQKADTSLATAAVETTTVGAILAHWAPPSITQGNWCTPPLKFRATTTGNFLRAYGTAF